jgi:uncharacterized protein
MSTGHAGSPRRVSRILIGGAAVLLALAAIQAIRSAGLFGGGTARGAAAVASALEFEPVDWIELIPRDDLDALLSPPDWIDDVEEGSDLEAALFDGGWLPDDPAFEGGQRYLEALRSTRTVAEWEGRAIRVPGFIVPLEFDDAGRVREFFLVPYFGACLHLPPPPPNQMILVRLAEGVPVPRLEDAFWVEGVLGSSVSERPLGTAAWELAGMGVRPYDWE